MPAQASPFTPIPSFLSRPAAPIGPQGPGGGMTPPGMPPMTPPGAGASGAPPPPGGGGLPSSNPMENMAAEGMGAAGDEPDLFQKVAQMMTGNPMWIAIFAGMGLREALEKSGKYVSKPHRSNEQLAQSGYNVGNAGQTGMPNEDQLAKQAMPPAPAQLGGQVGFPA